MTYNYTKKSSYPFLETVDELRLAFSEKGFWVVSNVNVWERIRNKVDSNFSEYITLWFCNPNHAYNYLKQDLNLWIFMPCSVSVYEKEGEVFINAWLPVNVIDKIVENKNIEDTSKEVSEVMKKVIDSI